MQRRVESRDFDRLDEWLAFCEWAIVRFSQDGQAINDHADEILNNSQGDEVLRTVCDFIGASVNEDNHVPLTARPGLASLLRELCAGFDYRLDMKKPVFLNHDDQLAEAINNTRSRGLQELFNFGTWVRRHEPDAEVSEVLAILDTRFSSSQYPLSRPEMAILGWYFDSAVRLDKDWTTDRVSRFFPRDSLQEWTDAFSNFLLSHGPNRQTYDILKDEFHFALEHTGELARSEHSAAAASECLGRHLFTYYMWGYYPLSGEESLLECYYERNSNSRDYWGRLFDYVGRTLRNVSGALDSGLLEKLSAFLEWRIKVGEPSELAYFTFWLEAECLEPEWRLKSFSKVLDVCDVDSMQARIQVDALGELLSVNTDLVVECLLKVTQGLRQDGSSYLRVETLRLILKAGLGNGDESVRNMTERTRDNLLRYGRSDLLDLED